MLEENRTKVSEGKRKILVVNPDIKRARLFAKLFYESGLEGIIIETYDAYNALEIIDFGASPAIIRNLYFPKWKDNKTRPVRRPIQDF